MRLKNKNLLLIFLFAISLVSPVMAAQLVVDSQTYNSTFSNGGFTSITFSPSFQQAPVVFVLPTIQGYDPSNVRVKNVSATSFQAAPTEPHRQDGPHVAMQSTSISADKGNYELPDGTKFEVGTTSTSAQQFGTGNPGTSTWHQVNFNVPFATPPIVVATIQTMNNEVGENGQLPPFVSSLPFIDVAIQGVSNTGFQVALERSEAEDGSVVTPEIIGYMAMEPATGTFVDDNNNTIEYKSFTYNGARGWTNGCITSGYPSGNFSSSPIAMASKRTRNNPDGGWVRRCVLSASQIGIRIDEDRETEGDNERSVSVSQAESISVIAFNRSFVVPFLTTYVPTFKVTKSSETLSDPINSNSNPKAIPGAIVEYSISVSNEGQGASDPNTFSVGDAVPDKTSLVVSGMNCGGAINIINGSPASGLSCGTVEFSQDGVDYSYTPVPSGNNNTDSSVRYVRINPNGIFSAATVGNIPNSTFKFRVEVD